MKADELFEIRNDKPIVMFNKLIEKLNVTLMKT